MNREMRRTIPGRHAVILAKVSELSNGKLPLEALENLYLREPDKYGMICKFQEEIRREVLNEQENDVCDMQQTDKQGIQG